jgi:PAS domain S-box-containing protein
MCALVRDLGQFTWTAGADGRLRDAEGWLSFTGQSAEALRAGDRFDAVHPDDRERAVAAWDAAIAADAPYECEYRLHRFDGVYRHVLERSVPVQFEDGTDGEWLCACIDVTERVELERQLRQTEEALGRSAREAKVRTDEFVRIVSHELKTPLTPAKLNIQMAARRIAECLSGAAPSAEDPSAATVTLLVDRLEGVRKLLERTDGQINRLDRLVSDLLDVSRIQADRLELRPQAFDLAALARDVVGEQRLGRPERVVALELPDVVSAPIYGDRDRIAQVLANYIGNALKYSAEDRSVAVRLTVEGDFARLAVRDKGRGLASAELERVWEAYYRTPDVEQSLPGLGLGLFICRTIVTLHHGEVFVESAAGRGSTFSFTLPLAHVSPLAAAQESGM